MWSAYPLRSIVPIMSKPLDSHRKKEPNSTAEKTYPRYVAIQWKVPNHGKPNCKLGKCIASAKKDMEWKRRLLTKKIRFDELTNNVPN